MRLLSPLLSVIAVLISVSSGFCEEHSSLGAADLKSFADASRRLKEEGRLEPFSLQGEYPKEHALTVGEWTIHMHTLGGSRAFPIVGLVNRNRTDGYGDVFADAAASRFAQKKDLDARSLFVPYRIARPDDAMQSMLAIGTKENLFIALFANNFYYRSYVPIKGLSITRKPALFFRYGEDEKGKHVQILVTDGSSVSRLHLGGVKTAVISVYPASMEALSSLKPKELTELTKMPKK